MFGLGSGEILVIALIALLLFGKEDLPATVKKISKGINDFRKATNDAQRQWAEIKDDVTRSLLDENQQKPVIRPAEHSLAAQSSLQENVEPSSTPHEVQTIADNNDHHVERSAESDANVEPNREVQKPNTNPNL